MIKFVLQIKMIIMLPVAKNLLPQGCAKVITYCMKKILVSCLFSCSILSLVSCFNKSKKSSDHLTFSTDQTVMLNWLELDEEGIVREAETDGNQTVSKEAFTGKAIETFEQSPTKSVSSWKNGKRHGTTLEYFYNGRKRTSIVYKDGQRHGPSQEFRITGELWREENYVNDQQTGSKSEWYPNGVKSFQAEMRNGIAHGEAKEWYQDGKEKSSTIYRHGLREGPSSEWYPNGQQKVGLFYQKDKQHGLRTIWYEDGTKRLAAQFVDDLIEGNSKGWFPNGQQQFDYNFKNNLEHGVCTEWNEEGEKISEIRFDHGVPTHDLLTGKRITTAPEPAPEINVISDDKPLEPASEPPAEEAGDTEPSPDLPDEIIPEEVTTPDEVEDLPNDSSLPIPETTEETRMSPPLVPQDPVVPSESAPLVPDLVETPPPPAVVPDPAEPSFDPFGDLSTDEPEVSPEEIPPPPSFTESLFEASESLDQKNNETTTIPSDNATPAFDPFEETPTPEESPFNLDASSTDRPFESASPPAFNPFEPSPPQEPEEMELESDAVPLGDIFGDPPGNQTESSQEGELPEEAPPPPPVFNPFDANP